MNQEDLKELINYDLLSGNFTWRKARGGLKVGGECGGTGGKGEAAARWISTGGKRYRAGCLAILYVTGKLPEFVIHKDGNLSNDAYSNLIASETKVQRISCQERLGDPRSPMVKLLDKLMMPSNLTAGN